MNDAATFTSDAASMKRRILLEQLITIRSSLMGKEGAAENDDSGDVIKDLAKKGMTLNKKQLTALSTEILLTVLLDVMLLRLLDEGATKPSTVSSAQQQLMDDAAAAKKKRKAAAKRRRHKRNKAAAKHEKTKLMSWLSGGVISVIMMVSFSFITTPIVTLSLFQPSDGSGEGNAPPALPPSASKPLRQKDFQPDDEASASPDIIRSPLAAVVPPPIFAPAAVSNHHMRMKSDEMRASTLCLDTPNWKDRGGVGCDWYEGWDLCRFADKWAGNLGSATTNCCFCDGGSKTCEDFRSKCQKYINVLDVGFNESGLVAPLCKEAESCSCKEAADYDVKIGTDVEEETVGLYNECKCNFWSSLCEDSGVGEACDYAAEYCCGDYSYDDDVRVSFDYLNSPTCYCDFFNFALNEFGHRLKPKALNISKEFENPCGQIQDLIAEAKSEGVDYRLEFERPSLEAILNIDLVNYSE